MLLLSGERDRRCEHAQCLACELSRAFFLSLLLLMGLTRCVVGPDYDRPNLEEAPSYVGVEDVLALKRMPQSEGTNLYTEADLQMQSLPPNIAEFRWEDFYLDPYLRTLIHHALSKNLTIKNMQSQLLAARANFIVTNAALYPSFEIDSSLERKLLSAITNTSPHVTNVFDLSGVVAWELDLWGGNQRGSESAYASLLSTNELLHYSYVSLISDLASRYYEWLNTHQRHQISVNTVKLRKKAYDLALLRRKNGVISGLEVQQAEVEYQTALATLPDLVLERMLAESQLRILLGEFDYPLDMPLETETSLETTSNAALNSSMRASVSSEKNGNIQHQSPSDERSRQNVKAHHKHISVPSSEDQLPSRGAQFPVWFTLGVPSQLLKFRPDVKSAEQDLIAANANIGLATSALFPSFTITGTYGRETDSLADFFNGRGLFWSLLTEIVAPVFNAGSLSADVEVARQLAIQAQLTYRNTLLTAYFEVNDAIQSYKRADESIVMQQTLVNAAAQYTHLARLRYINGVASSLDFMDAQRNLFSAQLSLSQIQRDKLLAMVELYRALGGGAFPTVSNASALNRAVQVP
ncbi:TolC family protein [Shewanella surugensis]|uniref:TolC family protein n=1 Tax=Shewanella surugensis TaxID=212020 RepID=A0ABT0L999_9GAMM|nr:TolC family protein [Shewanella surugensis]MCL1124279.1 TolC family protein [Shewanella surugensis]